MQAISTPPTFRALKVSVSYVGVRLCVGSGGSAGPGGSASAFRASGEVVGFSGDGRAEMTRDTVTSLEKSISSVHKPMEKATARDGHGVVTGGGAVRTFFIEPSLASPVLGTRLIRFAIRAS